MSGAVGLLPEQLEVRNKDSLIKYIGVLQTELQLIYDRQLLTNSAANENQLDFYGPPTLKSNDEDAHVQRRSEAARHE